MIYHKSLRYNTINSETFGNAVNILNWRAEWPSNHPHQKAATIAVLQCFTILSILLWAVHLRLTDVRSNVKSKIVFLLRTAWQPLTSIAWFYYLSQTYLRQAALSDVSLLDAIHRPFYDRNISAYKRLELLRNHYYLNHQLLGRELATSLFFGERLDISEFSGKNQQTYKLALFWSQSYKREGGLTLGLFLQDTLIQCLTFSLDRYQRNVLIRVGGMQSHNENTRDLIRETTKNLHGIQPRLLLIDALRFIAKEIHCTTIECIAKKNHIYEALRYKFNKRIRAEYDNLWLLAGATRHRNGNYLLPLTVEDKPIDSRPSNKRSEYRARDSIKQAIQDHISRTLAPLAMLAEHRNYLSA